MNKKIHIGAEFILAALAVVSYVLCFVIYRITDGMSFAARQILWLAMYALLPVFFLTGNKIFLKISVVSHSLLLIYAMILRVIFFRNMSYAVFSVEFVMYLMSAAAYVPMAVSLFLREGKVSSLMLKITVCVQIVLALGQFLLSAGAFMENSPSYVIPMFLSYLTDVLYPAAIAAYAFKSFAEKKKAGYKSAEEELRALRERLENGEITDTEYTAEKRKILKSI